MSIFTAEELAVLKANQTLAWPDVNVDISTYLALQVAPDAQFQVFDVQRKQTTNTSGNPQPTYVSVGTVSAVLGLPTQQQVDQFQQQQHPINYTVSHFGAAVAKPDYRLVLGTRHFYVQGVLDPNGFGLWTQYLVQERPAL
jgi:hypothetical protein